MYVVIRHIVNSYNYFIFKKFWEKIEYRKGEVLLIKIIFS